MCLKLGWPLSTLQPRSWLLFENFPSELEELRQRLESLDGWNETEDDAKQQENVMVLKGKYWTCCTGISGTCTPYCWYCYIGMQSSHTISCTCNNNWYCVCILCRVERSLQRNRKGMLQVTKAAEQRWPLLRNRNSFYNSCTHRLVFVCDYSMTASEVTQFDYRCINLPSFGQLLTLSPL